MSAEFVGGVAIDIVVPKYVPFAPYHVYLPLVGSSARNTKS